LTLLIIGLVMSGSKGNTGQPVADAFNQPLPPPGGEGVVQPIVWPGPQPGPQPGPWPNPWPNPQPGPGPGIIPPVQKGGALTDASPDKVPLSDLEPFEAFVGWG